MRIFNVFLMIPFLMSSLPVNGQSSRLSSQSDSAYYCSFFPMHVGDKWVYKVDPGDDDYAFYYYYEIVMDTVDSQNRHWFGRKCGDSGDIWFYTITDSFEVVYGFPDSDIVNLKYKLNAKPGDKWLIYGDYESGIVFMVDTIYDLGSGSAIMKIDEWNWDNYERTLWSSSRFLKTGFGLVKIWWEVGPSEYLIGAIIDGVVYGNPSEIEQEKFTLAYDFNLYQNYPNPFNSSTSIQYALPRNGFVRIAIYNISGQLVKTLVNGDRSVGTHTVSWDGIDERGRGVGSGIYFYCLQTGDFRSTKKLALLR
ncbi:MAG: T9SS type A sorting domain-containing protein, partial [Candidatus Marinimicrobia bacterium]|nr:T9SS type A sorting domain-containing protein [Candidatus Neomarinimicrobiota bacterium]